MSRSLISLESPMMERPMIVVEHLTKRFGQKAAVADISFEVRAGEVFAFLGPNGAGKTTTIQMLTTLLQPTSGKIRIDGFDPATDPNAVRRRFGIVFQDSTLDEELSVRENLELHCVLYQVDRAERQRRIAHVLELFNLTERRVERVKTLSGGLQRRLEIARALLHSPPLLFLDEPTLGLDTQTRNQLWDHAHHLNTVEGATVFFTTHYMEEAERHAHRVAIIDHGNIVAEGSPTALKQQTGVDTLEAAFLRLTGQASRDAPPNSLERLRSAASEYNGGRSQE